MIDFISTIQSIGNQALEFILFPLLIWTAIALPVAFWLHYSDAVPPVFHYHGRIALLITLPLGIVGTYLFNIISSTTSSAGTAALIVIQNPISVSASDSGVSIVNSVSDPVFWIGAVSLLLAIGILLMLFKIIINYFQLKKLQHQLNFSPLVQNRDLVSSLPRIPKDVEKTFIAFSKEANIPFTFGWQKTKIVIPADLKKDSDALAMAVQHELIHIKHHDFLLNGLLILIKALFWFHPLVHYLYNSGQEYREITCDGEVLAEKQFSKKQYASLLFELAKREHHKNIAISMAVNPSSLKKRIQIMSSQNNLPITFRSSFLTTFIAATLLTVTISCTDMADDGITKSEVEQTQSKITTMSSSSSPLYIINGEEWEQTQANKDKLSRLKSKYIESVTVLKGENATDEYGQKGQNGVLKMEILNPDKAFADLRDSAPQAPTQGSKAEDGNYYLAVEEMPRLVGGLGALQKKINYPEKARQAGAEGRVIIQFIVDKEGNVVDPTILKGEYESLNNEALRVVKQAEFTPGLQDGEPVRVQYSLPISYKLPSPNK